MNDRWIGDGRGVATVNSHGRVSIFSGANPPSEEGGGGGEVLFLAKTPVSDGYGFPKTTVDPATSFGGGGRRGVP